MLLLGLPKLHLLLAKPQTRVAHLIDFSNKYVGDSDAECRRPQGMVVMQGLDHPLGPARWVAG